MSFIDTVTTSEVMRVVKYSYIEIHGTQYKLSNYPYLDIVLTDFCNSSCRFCIADLLEEKIQCNPEVFKIQISKAVNELGVKEVLLVGGEPTVSKDLFNIINFCKTLPLNKICITTNGKRLADKVFLKSLMSSGITHMNISIMSFNSDAQLFVHRTASNMTLELLADIYNTSREHSVSIRINNNVYRGNNDSVDSLLEFYNTVKPYCDSVKFSPLLKTDSYSVIPETNAFNRDYILDPDEYEKLFNQAIKELGGNTLSNTRTFGFVEYRMVLQEVPVIFNYNHRGQMLLRATEFNEINNIKLLPNGNLSRSWNRNEASHVLFFAPQEVKKYAI